MTTSKAVMMEILKKAPDPSKMADLFGEWYKKLPLPHNKCLMPLAHNWPFDRAFVEDWLGRKHYEHFFHPYYRDLMARPCCRTTSRRYHLQQYPYPKMNLGYLCNLLGIENMKAHDALGDCMATAACYRELLRRSTWTPVALTADQAKEIPVEDRATKQRAAWLSTWVTRRGSVASVPGTTRSSSTSGPDGTPTSRASKTAGRSTRSTPGSSGSSHPSEKSRDLLRRSVRPDPRAQRPEP